MKTQKGQKWLCGVGMLTICFILTGCGHEHTWMEVTCTVPKTCSECGETEGEALGHTWEKATCTEPKICSVCKETEGEALGHTLSEATYWEAAVCSVCGETVGDALTPAFEELGVKGQFMEVGKTYDYNTRCILEKDLEKQFIDALQEGYVVIDADGIERKVEGDYTSLEDFFLKGVYADSYVLLNGETVKLTGENIVAYLSEQYSLTGDYKDLTELYADISGIDLNARAAGQVKVTDYQVFDFDETHEAKDGYEWKTIEMQIVFSDENARNIGVTALYLQDHYYYKDDTDNGEDSENEYDWDNEATQTINWKGKEYTECRATVNGDWTKDENGNFFLPLQFEFFYPKGYDGGLVAFIDSGYTGTLDNFSYADDNTLFFRLQ